MASFVGRAPRAALAIKRLIIVQIRYALTSLKTTRILYVHKGGFQCKKN